MWISFNQVITNISTTQKEILYAAELNDHTISSEDLIKSQKVDITLKRINVLKQKQTVINERERRKESTKTIRYLRQWNSLLADDNVLYRKILDEKPSYSY